MRTRADEEDFTPYWKALTPRQYAYAAWEVMRSVQARLGIQLEKVVLTTDEKDEEWLSV